MPPESLPPDPPRPRVHAPRLPGTYAANYESDMNWRRGVAVLWILFGAMAVCEAVYTAFYYLQGGVDYFSPFTAGRLVAEAALFLALWVGWGWLRWVLASVDFLYGAWLVMWLIASHTRDPNAPPDTPPPVWGIASIPILATALVYLTTAMYLAFSADVLDFLRHRREEGRGWVVAPLAALVGFYLLTLFSAQTIYLRWLNLERASAARFVTESVQTISTQRWDAEAYESRADPGYLKTWFEGDRKDVFHQLSRLGEFRDAASPPKAAVGSSLDATGGGYVVRGQVQLGQVNFVHGNTVFTIDVTRTLFGPWKMQSFDAGNPRFDAASSSTK